MTPYMLDTNICSYIIRKRPEVVRKKLNEAVARGELIVISSITYFEMLRGSVSKKASPKLPGEITALCTRLHDILPFDREAADHAAAIYEALASKGRIIGNNDILIAGHAIAAGYTLVTNNTREFRRVQGLALEDWSV